MLNRYQLCGVVFAVVLCRCAVAQQAHPTARLKVAQTQDAITVTQDGQVVLRYVKQSPPAPAGIEAVYQRSGCLHPVNTPGGRTVTQMFPADHAHQHGVFTAWVNTTYGDRKIDFWNLAGGTGRVLHERVVSTFEQLDKAGFEVDLIHRIEQDPKVDVLRERWKVTVDATDGPYYQFDLQTNQEAITDTPLVVEKYHYGGFALRGPVRWLLPRDGWAKTHPDLALEPSAFLNSAGSDRVAGNHQHVNWVALTGQLDGQSTTTAVLSHRDNFRAPQAARLHPTKPYFCYSPCVDGSFTIDRAHPYQTVYRFLITDAAPDAPWIEGQWKAWCEAGE